MKKSDAASFRRTPGQRSFVCAFAAFLGRSSDTALAEDVRRFQVHQAETGVQAPTINGSVSALRFLFMRHFVHTTLFICVLRFVSTLLAEHSELSEAEFWRAARRVVDRYVARFPDLSERIAIFDILGEFYPRLCLNRVRLFTHGYIDDAERPVPAWAGEVRNPLRAF